VGFLTYWFVSSAEEQSFETSVSRTEASRLSF
jgi:hypothetical protein